MRKIFSIAFIVLLSLGLVCTRPFDIYADSYMDHIVGTTYSNQKNIITWTFDEHLLGSMDVTISYKLSPNGVVNQIRPYIRVNGTQVSYVIYNDWLYDVSFTIDNSYFEPVSGMDLTTIISYLSQMYDTQEDILDQLELIYGNTDLISKLRQYSFPFESLNFNMYLLNNYNPVDISSYYSWTYPSFKIPNGSPIYMSHLLQRDREYFLICDFGNNIYDLNTLQQRITFDNNNFSFKTYQQLMTYWDGSITHQIVKATFSSSTAAGSVLTQIINNTGSDLQIVPFYCNYISANNDFSTDFALVFGFSNQLLDDLHIIANGTTQSNNSSSNLEDMNDDYDDVSQQVFGLENNFSTGFDSSMQNVPTTFNFGTQFGNKFLATATWVRTQFDTMTTNTPFGALITFSLVLGLALLIVGRRLL